MVEHHAVNVVVPGSSPGGGAFSTATPPRAGLSASHPAVEKATPAELEHASRSSRSEQSERARTSCSCSSPGGGAFSTATPPRAGLSASHPAVGKATPVRTRADESQPGKRAERATRTVSASSSPGGGVKSLRDLSASQKSLISGDGAFCCEQDDERSESAASRVSRRERPQQTTETSEASVARQFVDGSSVPETLH